MIDQLFLRKRVRFVLSAVPKNRRIGEEILLQKLAPDFPGLRPDDLRIAIEWNQGQGFIDYVFNGDEERDEWALTARGRAKEGLA